MAAIVALAVVPVVVLAALPPIADDPAYHRFADDREALGVPSFWNVVSNLPFGVVGALGLALVLRRDSRRFPAGTAERAPWVVFFLGVLGTAAGSSWYHLDPTPERLFWDRLPMALGFMGLVAAVVSDRISVRAGALLLVPLAAAGLASVLLWRASGDVRAYAAVQYVPFLVLPAMLALFPSRRGGTRLLLAAFLWYGAAKAFELLDRPIYELGRIVSGHTLKHLAAAASAATVAVMLRRTAPAPPPRAPDGGSLPA